MADVKKEEKKGPLGKLKEVAEDKEEQLQYLATLIRVIVPCVVRRNLDVKLR